MKKTILLFITGFITLVSFGQKIDDVINAKEVERIEKILAADDMQGRKPYTAGIDKAAEFIANEFKQSKLGFMEGTNSYKQEFVMIKSKFISAEGNLNGKEIASKNIIAFTSQPEIKINQSAGYTIVKINKADDFFKTAIQYIEASSNQLVLVDAAHANNFGRLLRFKRELFKKETNVIFILTDAIENKEAKADSNTSSPQGSEENYSYEFVIKHEIIELKLSNVVGVIPGKTKPDELVVFSGHYDHLGIGKPTVEMDSIYNGANDDAAGTTAVIMLAKYFAAQKTQPERTLVFVAFTAEEVGGFGSRYFSKQINAEKTIAMLNIEMIGTESKWGANSAYITGYEKSDLGKILQQNLAGSKFKFEPDPYPEQQLFYRSDNATLAALGVPAHTISTSKMDSEKYYHTADDEIETLDMNNMAEIIKSIAISATGIINGTQTPSRVEKMK